MTVVNPYDCLILGGTPQDTPQDGFMENELSLENMILSHGACVRIVHEVLDYLGRIGKRSS